jgi:hypothetical protein
MRCAWIVLVAACGNDVASCPTTDFAAQAPAQATVADVTAIVEEHCALGGCHLHAPGAGGLVLDVSSPSWPDLVIGVPAQENPAMDLVTAGDPDQSWLVHKVFGEFCGATCDPILGCGAAMPFGAALSDADRATIARWIELGAR